VLLIIEILQDGTFSALNDPDEEKIRARIGVYYNYFTKPSDDDNVVFSVPYNDTGGLGMCVMLRRSSLCKRKTCRLVLH